MPVGFPAKTDFAPGAVLTAAQMNDITGTLNTVSGAVGQIAGKNAIINGAFDFWQRGTSFSNPADGSYTADRWLVTYNGTGATRTISQQTFTPGTAPVTGYEGQYFYRYNQSVAGTGGAWNELQTRIEDVRTYAGQTVTLSFWAKAASATTLPSIRFRQYFGSTGGASTQVDTTAASSINLTTSWQRFTYTVAIPSIAGKTIGTGVPPCLILQINLPLNSTFTVDMWGVQVESGTQASTFSRAAGTLAGELAACQRYFVNFSETGSVVSLGYYEANTVAVAILPLPVKMRTAPSLTATSGAALYTFKTAAGGSDTVNSLSLGNACTTAATVFNSTDAVGTGGQAGQFIINAGGSVSLSAEL